MKREEIEDLINIVEQDSLQFAEITTRKREINARLNEMYNNEKHRQRELLPAVSYDEIVSVAWAVLRNNEVYQTLQSELDALEDEGMQLIVALEKGRSMVLLELIERSAEAFPLQLLSTKLSSFQ